MTPTEEMALRAARSDAAFDGRTFEGMGRADRERYLARCRAALTAALEGREEPGATAEPVAWRAWDDANCRWNFTLWPAESPGWNWSPLYPPAPPTDIARIRAEAVAGEQNGGDIK